MNVQFFSINAKKVDCLIILIQVCTVLQVHSESWYRALRQSGMLVTPGSQYLRRVMVMVDSPLNTVGIRVQPYILEELQRYLGKECTSTTPQRWILKADAMKISEYAGLLHNIQDGAAVDTLSEINRALYIQSYQLV